MSWSRFAHAGFERRGLARALLFIGTAGVTLTALAAPDAAPLFGFSAAQSLQERGIEQRFDAALHAEQLRAWLKTLSAEPNHVGSPHDKANAEMVRDLFRALGLGCADRGIRRALPDAEVTYPGAGRAHQICREPQGAGRSRATRARRAATACAPYNEYGADGDVTGELVYLNYGMPQDYKDLARRGIDVRGKIVITRYGGGWRGLKPKLAQEHGAIGCIIYSDPHDDGYAMGDVYPQGGWRPDGGVQRGSVLDMTALSGRSAHPGRRRDQGRQAPADRRGQDDPEDPRAADLLRRRAALARRARRTGGAAPLARLRCPITYHMGPGPARVHLAVSSDWGQKPLYDVIARIRWQREPG